MITSGLLYVPDEHGMLTPAEQLVFNDAPWLGLQQEAAHLVHPKISFEVRRGAHSTMAYRFAKSMYIGSFLDCLYLTPCCSF